MESLGTVLERHRGLGPGFDFLRVGLATAIVAAHCFRVAGATWYFDTPLWFIDYAFVPMFFALSGFLITGSAQRLSLKNFLINRGLRIVPALAVDVVFCAVILGPLVTTVPLSEYFSSSLFYLYFLNVTGYIHYMLPGVFVGHPDPQVNGALWTVPWEVLCYVVMSIMIITQAVRRPALVMALVVAYMIVGIILQTGVVDVQTNFLLRRLNDLTTNRGAQALTAFLFGILSYQLRFRIPHSKALMALSVGLCVVGALMLGRKDVWIVWHRPILIPALTYITMYLGLVRIPIPGYFRRGDYSYGIYLYHIPLLQVILMWIPGLRTLPVGGPIALFALGFPVITLFATGSWHWIEKPILGLRKKFSFVARARGIEVKDSETIAPEPISDDKAAMAGSEARADTSETARPPRPSEAHTSSVGHT